QSISRYKADNDVEKLQEPPFTIKPGGVYGFVAFYVMEILTIYVGSYHEKKS
ncbi:20939_t:CDS:1, partial [Gigaspora margarita]